jgi:tRNA-dihydrouridine synthase
MQNFWQTLPKPFLEIAPMADVTDPAFRAMFARYGRPDVMWTEFVSADGLYHTREIEKIHDAENPLLKDLVFSENERPIVAQIFSGKPEMIEYASALMVQLGFDGVDINMGCPHRPVEKQGAGAALIKTPDKARELIRSAKRGVNGRIPVSVKTRIGYNKNEIDTWLQVLLEEAPAVITIHARTRKEMSKVPARWEHVKEAVRIRDRYSNASQTLIAGNGDITSKDDALLKARETGADGVMVGRGVFGNPWFFADFAHRPCECKIERPAQTLPKENDHAHNTTNVQHFENATQSRNSAERSECVAGVMFCDVCAGYCVKPSQRLHVLIEHCKAFDTLCSHKNYAVMKKHFKAYVNGFPGAQKLRTKLFEAQNTEEVTTHIKRFLKINV